jgi:excisionase family DNA binding protein
MADVHRIDDDILEVEDAARMLHMSVSWTQKAAARGDIPSFKLGSRRLYRRSSLRRHIEEREQKEARS